MMSRAKVVIDFKILTYRGFSCLSRYTSNIAEIFVHIELAAQLGVRGQLSEKVLYRLTFIVTY